MRANARSLQISSMKRMPALQKNEMRPNTGPSFVARHAHRVEHGHRVGQRERDLLHRRRADFLQVIASRC